MRFIRGFIIVLLSVAGLTACESMFGKGKAPYDSRIASLEHRRDEEVFVSFYEVFFEPNSVSLSDEARLTVDHVAEMIIKSKPTITTITGYTDSFGNAQYNKLLSSRRAKAVVSALQAKGVNTSKVRVQALGEEDPSIPTQDEVKILENRRVVIQLKK